VLHRSWRVLLLLSLFVLDPLRVSAADSCTLKELVQVPITMVGPRPTVEAKINGMPALFTLDSGAFWSSLTPAAAEQYQLRVDYARALGITVRGVGGAARIGIATVENFTVFTANFHRVDFVVGFSEPGAGTVGLLGQNVLRIADVEYDLGAGRLGLFKPEHCQHANLAYWVKEGEPYAEVDIADTTARNPHTTGFIRLNGARVKVVFDTGAASSMVGLRAAAAAGLKPGNPQVEPAGISFGIGTKTVQTWIANFPVLKIGDEEVHNARLRIADLDDFDMLLGDDFFLSHRVFVANSQHKLYFTYQGGPVFARRPRSESSAPDAAPGSSPAAASSAPLPAVSSAAEVSDSTSTDAADLTRRAAASAARRDFETALRDINRAIELSPQVANYYFQRALIQFSLNRSELAAHDLDKAISLDPGYADALLRRAAYRIYKKDTTGAVADLEAVDQLEPKESDLRLVLAELFDTLQLPGRSIPQLNLWMKLHDQDARMLEAYNLRCRGRALLGEQLEQALRDCNAALRLAPKDGAIYDSRGLVHLRREQYDDAIDDYNQSLKLRPKSAWSLYGRGIAELRKGMTAQGQADISAAQALDPHLAQLAGQYGISP